MVIIRIGDNNVQLNAEETSGKSETEAISLALQKLAAQNAELMKLETEILEAENKS